MTLSTLQEQFSEVLNFLVEEKNQYTKDDRVLIYVMSISVANHLSKYLNCQVLHRDVEDKEFVLTKFRSQNSSVLVCTSVLSAGFDYSSVRAVIYFQVFAVPGLAPPRIGQSAPAQPIAAFPGHKYSPVPLRLPTFLLISFVSFAWAFCRLLVSVP